MARSISVQMTVHNQPKYIQILVSTAVSEPPWETGGCQQQPGKIASLWAVPDGPGDSLPLSKANQVWVSFDFIKQNQKLLNISMDFSQFSVQLLRQPTVRRQATCGPRGHTDFPLSEEPRINFQKTQQRENTGKCVCVTCAVNRVEVARGLSWECPEVTGCPSLKQPTRWRHPWRPDTLSSLAHTPYDMVPDCTWSQQDSLCPFHPFKATSF